MSAFTAEDRRALLDSTRKLLASRSSLPAVRGAMETEDGYDASLWRELADLGLVGLIVDEQFGGSGGSPIELEAVMEEVGAALLCAPLLSSGVLAVGLLQTLGDAEAARRLLPGVANGSLVATVAATGPIATWTPKGVDVRAAQDGATWRLDGKAAFVTHGQIADVLLVAAHASDGLAVFEVDPAASGVAIDSLPTFDRTLRLADIGFQGVVARRLRGEAPAGEALERSLELTRLALAGEQAGAGRRVLDFTVEYAKARYQFGRPIGSFQAIKHMAADLLLEAESAISAARNAAAQLAVAAPGARAAVNLAAFACADAFVKICADSIQMHGGIAFTWDHPAHLYLRRARADAQLFGGPAAHRERYLEELGG